MSQDGRRLDQLLLLALTSPEPGERHAALEALRTHIQTHGIDPHTLKLSGSGPCECPDCSYHMMMRMVDAVEKARERRRAPLEAQYPGRPERWYRFADRVTEWLGTPGHLPEGWQEKISLVLTQWETEAREARRKYRALGIGGIPPDLDVDISTLNCWADGLEPVNEHVLSMLETRIQNRAHEVRLYRELLHTRDWWVSHRELVKRTEIPPGYVSNLLQRFMELGLVDQNKKQQYRLSRCPNQAEMLRLHEAAAAIDRWPPEWRGFAP